jgi:asparagine synthase (glutamine-hydrolysing)
MCGICGKYSPQGVQPQEVERMLDTIAHRGPDDSGSYYARQHRAGQPPPEHHRSAQRQTAHPNEDGTVWIVYNGEMYNYPSCAESWKPKGHTFRTHSDTEAIVHLYEEMGERCVEKLSGMFAFALWDETSRNSCSPATGSDKSRSFTPRTAGTFCLGPRSRRSLRFTARTRRWTRWRCTITSPCALLPRLAPSSKISKSFRPPIPWSIQHGKITLRRYWQLSFREKLTLSEAEILEALREQLKQTVDSHLLSDVPVGAFLSGGLDSSMVIAVLARDLGLKPQTFSIGVAESDFDETPTRGW